MTSSTLLRHLPLQNKHYKIVTSSIIAKPKYYGVIKPNILIYLMAKIWTCEINEIDLRTAALQYARSKIVLEIPYHFTKSKTSHRRNNIIRNTPSNQLSRPFPKLEIMPPSLHFERRVETWLKTEENLCQVGLSWRGGKPFLFLWMAFSVLLYSILGLFWNTRERPQGHMNHKANHQGMETFNYTSKH